MPIGHKCHIYIKEMNRQERATVGCALSMLGYGVDGFTMYHWDIDYVWVKMFKSGIALGSWNTPYESYELYIKPELFTMDNSDNIKTLIALGWSPFKNMEIDHVSQI